MWMCRLWVLLCLCFFLLSALPIVYERRSDDVNNCLRIRRVSDVGLQSGFREEVAQMVWKEDGTAKGSSHGTTSAQSNKQREISDLQEDADSQKLWSVSGALLPVNGGGLLRGQHHDELLGFRSRRSNEGFSRLTHTPYGRTCISKVTYVCKKLFLSLPLLSSVIYAEAGTVVINGVTMDDDENDVSSHFQTSKHYYYTASQNSQRKFRGCSVMAPLHITIVPSRSFSLTFEKTSFDTAGSLRFHFNRTFGTSWSSWRGREPQNSSLSITASIQIIDTHFTVSQRGVGLGDSSLHSFVHFSVRNESIGLLRVSVAKFYGQSYFSPESHMGPKPVFSFVSFAVADGVTVESLLFDFRRANVYASVPGDLYKSISLVNFLRVPHEVFPLLYVSEAPLVAANKAATSVAAFANPPWRGLSITMEDCTLAFGGAGNPFEVNFSAFAWEGIVVRGFVPSVLNELGHPVSEKGDALITTLGEKGLSSKITLKNVGVLRGSLSGEYYETFTPSRSDACPFFVVHAIRYFFPHASWIKIDHTDVKAESGYPSVSAGSLPDPVALVALRTLELAEVRGSYEPFSLYAISVTGTNLSFRGQRLGLAVGLLLACDVFRGCAHINVSIANMTISNDRGQINVERETNEFLSRGMAARLVYAIIRQNYSDSIGIHVAHSTVTTRFFNNFTALPLPTDTSPFSSIVPEWPFSTSVLAVDLYNPLSRGVLRVHNSTVFGGYPPIGCDLTFSESALKATVRNRSGDVDQSERGATLAVNDTHIVVASLAHSVLNLTALTIVSEAPSLKLTSATSSVGLRLRTLADNVTLEDNIFCIVGSDSVRVGDKTGSANGDSYVDVLGRPPPMQYILQDLYPQGNSVSIRPFIRNTVTLKNLRISMPREGILDGEGSLVASSPLPSGGSTAPNEVSPYVGFGAIGGCSLYFRGQTENNVFNFTNLHFRSRLQSGIPLVAISLEFGDGIQIDNSEPAAETYFYNSVVSVSEVVIEAYSSFGVQFLFKPGSLVRILELKVEVSNIVVANFEDVSPEVSSSVSVPFRFLVVGSFADQNRRTSVSVLSSIFSTKNMWFVRSGAIFSPAIRVRFAGWSSVELINTKFVHVGTHVIDVSPSHVGGVVIIAPLGVDFFSDQVRGALEGHRFLATTIQIDGLTVSRVRKSRFLTATDSAAPFGTGPQQALLYPFNYSAVTSIEDPSTIPQGDFEAMRDRTITSSTSIRAVSMNFIGASVKNCRWDIKSVFLSVNNSFITEECGSAAVSWSFTHATQESGSLTTSNVTMPSTGCGVVFQSVNSTFSKLAVKLLGVLVTVVDATHAAVEMSLSETDATGGSSFLIEDIPQGRIRINGSTATLSDKSFFGLSRAVPTELRLNPPALIRGSSFIMDSVWPSAQFMPYLLPISLSSGSSVLLSNLRMRRGMFEINSESCTTKMPCSVVIRDSVFGAKISRWPLQINLGAKSFSNNTIVQVESCFVTCRLYQCPAIFFSMNAPLADSRYPTNSIISVLRTVVVLGIPDLTNASFEGPHGSFVQITGFLGLTEVWGNTIVYDLMYKKEDLYRIKPNVLYSLTMTSSQNSSRGNAGFLIVHTRVLSADGSVTPLGDGSFSDLFTLSPTDALKVARERVLGLPTAPLIAPWQALVRVSGVLRQIEDARALIGCNDPPPELDSDFAAEFHLCSGRVAVERCMTDFLPYVSPPGSISQPFSFSLMPREVARVELLVNANLGTRWGRIKRFKGSSAYLSVRSYSSSSAVSCVHSSESFVQPFMPTDSVTPSLEETKSGSPAFSRTRSLDATVSVQSTSSRARTLSRKLLTTMTKDSTRTVATVSHSATASLRGAHSSSTETSKPIPIPTTEEPFITTTGGGNETEAPAKDTSTVVVYASAIDKAPISPASASDGFTGLSAGSVMVADPVTVMQLDAIMSVMEMASCSDVNMLAHLSATSNRRSHGHSSSSEANSTKEGSSSDQTTTSGTSSAQVGVLSSSSRYNTFKTQSGGDADSNGEETTGDASYPYDFANNPLHIFIMPERGAADRGALVGAIVLFVVSIVVLFGISAVQWLRERSKFRKQQKNHDSGAGGGSPPPPDARFPPYRGPTQFPSVLLTAVAFVLRFAVRSATRLALFPETDADIIIGVMALAVVGAYVIHLFYVTFPARLGGGFPPWGGVACVALPAPLHVPAGWRRWVESIFGPSVVWKALDDAEEVGADAVTLEKEGMPPSSEATAKGLSTTANISNTTAEHPPSSTSSLSPSHQWLSKYEHYVRSTRDFPWHTAAHLTVSLILKGLASAASSSTCWPRTAAALIVVFVYLLVLLVLRPVASHGRWVIAAVSNVLLAVSTLLNLINAVADQQWAVDAVVVVAVLSTVVSFIGTAATVLRMIALKSSDLSTAALVALQSPLFDVGVVEVGGRSDATNKKKPLLYRDGKANNVNMLGEHHDEFLSEPLLSSEPHDESTSTSTIENSEQCGEGHGQGKEEERDFGEEMTDVPSAAPVGAAEPPRSPPILHDHLSHADALAVREVLDDLELWHARKRVPLR